MAKYTDEDLVKRGWFGHDIGKDGPLTWRHPGLALKMQLSPNTARAIESLCDARVAAALTAYQNIMETCVTCKASLMHDDRVAPYCQDCGEPEPEVVEEYHAAIRAMKEPK